ncbi:MAG: ParA family protein [Candidatus Eremiobacteraeota bacterium]|nr:ParA family protein [Candidatus Eremiobacteraeota bacterium]
MSVVQERPNDETKSIGKQGKNGFPQRKKACLLTISSSKGGSCKSTTTRNLAVAAVHGGLSVATVDLDAQQTLTIWNNRRPEAAPTISHYSFALTMANNEIKALVHDGGFDLVIVDTPPGVENHATEMRMLVRASDYVLLPTQQQSSDLDSVIEWARTVKREGARFGFLLSRTARNRRSFQEAKQRLVEVGPLAPIDIRDLASVDVSNKMGVGNIEIRRDAVGDDFLAAWHFIAREIGISLPRED